MSDNLTILQITANFKDRHEKPVSVFKITGGPANFAAFAFQCQLNLDIDGAPKTYGLNNPAAKNSLGQPNLQKNLDPLEGPKYHGALGNACGDPVEQGPEKGYDNWAAGNRKFYWAGLVALTQADARRLGVDVDLRPILEAGLAKPVKKGQPVNLLPKGLGHFPVVQGKDGTAPGYYISTTSTITETSLDRFNPQRYVNSETVPFTVWANEWLKHKIGKHIVSQGDIGICIRIATGAHTAFVFGDSGTANKVGESSLKLHNTIGGGTDPVLFLAFPGSGNGKVLGRSPEVTIPFRTLIHSMRLGPNAIELATRIALGLGKPIPKGQAELTTPQAAIQQKLIAAFRHWALVPTS